MPSNSGKKVKSKISKKNHLKNGFLHLCSCCAICLILVVTSSNINLFIRNKKILGAKTDITQTKESNLATKKVYWESFLNSNPTYQDGWINLAKTDFELGNKEAGISALMKAKAINPNSEKIKELEILSTK
jgi:hypothetical protein